MRMRTCNHVHAHAHAHTACRACACSACAEPDRSGVRLHVLFGEGAHALRELNPQRRDHAQVLAVEDVETAAPRGERHLVWLEEAARKLALRADKVAVLGGDDDPAAGAQRHRVQRLAQLHVRVEQCDELLLHVHLLEPEHHGGGLVVRRVAYLVNERVAEAHVVVDEGGADVQAAVGLQLLV